MGSLFGEVVGIKKLNLGRVVWRENKASFDHQPLRSTSFHGLLGLKIGRRSFLFLA